MESLDKYYQDLDSLNDKEDNVDNDKIISCCSKKENFIIET